jgi:hypothetical protein
MNDRARDKPVAAAAPVGARQISAGINETPTLAAAEREQALAAGQGVLVLQAASGAADPPPSFRFTPSGVMALQRTVGNRAVAEAMKRMVQRVPVTGGGAETLYNQPGAGGTAAAEHYGGPKTFDMTRDGDASVTVTVRIKFVRQTRNTLPPTPPATTPKVGQLTGLQTVLPAGDQAWATGIAATALAAWNGRLTLVGEETNVFSKNTKKRLPVTFKSVALFGLTDAADKTIVVHPPGVVGGSTGNPIDAGNYYMKKNDGVYPAGNNIIYAHEYGHLIGISDEYSQNNEQLNLLLHKAAPGTAASSMAALDQKTVERMALKALTAPLVGQLQATIAAVTDAIRAQRKPVKAKMARAARDAAKTADVRNQLRTQLAATSEAALNPKIPGVVAFETTSNFSNLDLANQGVEAGFAPAALGTQIGDAYTKALDAPQSEKVAVTGFGDVSINVQSSVGATTGAGTALQPAAAAEAGGVVGKTGPGLPAIPPPPTLVGQLAAAPATWSTAGGAIESGITAAAFAAKMVATLKAQAASAAPPPGVAPPPKLASARSLYEKAYALINSAARTASRQVAADLVKSSLDPILVSSVTALQTVIGAEVTRLMTSTPAQLAANPAPDPNMAAIVAGMKTRLDTAKTALAGTGQDPLGVAGATTPAQDVTYSYQGLMGSNKTTELRAEQFQPVVDGFNDKLKTFWEKKFGAEVK